MLFLFNDVIFEIGQPLERIATDDFPVSLAAVEKMHSAEIVLLAKETIFADLQLAHSSPKKAEYLAVLLAAKLDTNAVLIGPPANGASTAAEIGIRLAEVSLVTMSNLWQLQIGNTLSSEHVYQSVWSSLSK